jgi:hypothetical protein
MPPLIDGNPAVTLIVPVTVPRGIPVPIRMQFENTTPDPLELILRGREPAYDFVVTAASGKVVWRRLAGEMVFAILRIEIINPGQILEFRDSWDQHDNAGDLVPPGTYTLRGVILSDGNSTLESAVIPFRIRPK